MIFTRQLLWKTLCIVTTWTPDRAKHLVGEILLLGGQRVVRKTHKIGCDYFIKKQRQILLIWLPNIVFPLFKKIM